LGLYAKAQVNSINGYSLPPYATGKIISKYDKNSTPPSSRAAKYRYSQVTVRTKGAEHRDILQKNQHIS